MTINSLGDDGVDNPGDGICATGNPFGPGGFLNECTLRAALEEANAVPGLFRIEISDDISVNAQDFSQIDINSGLPAITDRIILGGDGSASAGAATVEAHGVVLPAGVASKFRLPTDGRALYCGEESARLIPFHADSPCSSPADAATPTPG